MTSPNNNIIPQTYKMTDNTSAGVGVQNFEPPPPPPPPPRPQLPQQQNFEPRLPEDWKVVKFDSCINKQNSKEEKIKKQEYKIYGRYPVIDQGQDLIAGYWDNEKDVYKKNLPVIIFGDHTRIIKYIDFPFVTGADGTKILVPNTSVVFPRFFYYSLLNLKIPSRGYNRHYSLLRESKIPLPPLPEQQKIAAVLSAVQEAKEKTEAVIAAIKALKKSMMKHLFTYGPVSPQEAENVPLKETEIGPVPEDWEVVKLGEVFKEISKERITLINEEKIYKQLTVKLYSKGIQLREINFGRKIGVKKQYHVSTGDFIFSKIDARNGAYGFISEDLNDGIVSGDFPILQLNKKICNQQFLSYYLSIEKNWIYLRNIAVGTTNRKRVQPKEFLSYLLLPLPPLPIQQKIASILSAIDEKIEAEENKKKALEELFKSLLHNLMTAKIRVNQLEISS